MRASINKASSAPPPGPSDGVADSLDEAKAVVRGAVGARSSKVGRNFFVFCEPIVCVVGLMADCEARRSRKENSHDKSRPGRS